MAIIDLQNEIKDVAFAFRGYDVKNLGRTPELLAIPAYRPILLSHLATASEECCRTLRKKVDLAAKLLAEEEFELDHYGEAIAMIVAVEQAQLEILATWHGINPKEGAFYFGFSLGEISALIASGVFTLPDALRIPLTLVDDCIELARDVTLGIVFSRKEELSFEKLQRTLQEINTCGEGVIGVSTHLSPNSVLVMGSGKTIDLLKVRLKEDFPAGTNLRCNDNRWPPLHTPIVWEKDLNSRTARQLHTIPGGFQKPSPNILSLVTGQFSYTESNAREHMIKWVDHPQKMWAAVCEVLYSNVKCIVHLGPEPNIIPSTFDRLRKNVDGQISVNRGMQALSAAVDRPWLRKLLPERTDLLRAAKMEHIVLEDWLIEHAPDDTIPVEGL